MTINEIFCNNEGKKVAQISLFRVQNSKNVSKTIFVVNF